MIELGIDPAEMWNKEVFRIEVNRFKGFNGKSNKNITAHLSRRNEEESKGKN